MAGRLARTPEPPYDAVVSYSRDVTSLESRKQHVRHLVAQKLGGECWYETYQVRVARVERAYAGPRR